MPINAYPQNVLRILGCIIFFAFLGACGDNKLETPSNEPGSENNEPQPPSTKGTYAGNVVIDLRTKPELNRDPLAETTEIILQFVPRNSDNFPLSPEQVIVSMRINDEAIDPESIIESSSEQLAFNVNLGLVLDASSSMALPPEDPPFPAMLEAAKNSVEKGFEIWAEQEGEFSFHTTWFNNAIFSSVDTADQQWAADDIMDIPLPRRSGQFTRLYAAVDYAVEKMAENASDPLSEVRDQNIILVFSDGKDNHSSKDDADAPVQQLFTKNDAEYQQLGREKTTLETLLEDIDTQENISVHVIGMGDKISVDNLKSIAEAGNGLYLQNPDASDLDKPFQRVIQEFTTLQTQGIVTPKPVGEYKFTLRVENALGKEAAECSFQFKIEAESAALINTDGENICTP
ncbi:MAG TPA: VWA domain-containing protein [Gammaproteobacteria bacterium]|nr:VWA domain-containing protein [Gammaproteobacteria bacterium]